MFAELAPHLTDRFRVLALTRRGHGLTDRVRSGHVLADAAEDARRLLDPLGIERAHMVGLYPSTSTSSCRPCRSSAADWPRFTPEG